MNHDSFFIFQNESRIDNSQKFENRAYPIKCQNCVLFKVSYSFVDILTNNPSKYRLLILG